MTILTQRVGHGPTRRCDSKCHDAKREPCDCICGGRYHGKGRQAQDLLTKDFLGKDWNKTKAAMPGADGLMVGRKLQQLVLPLTLGGGA
jgi:hypothetical protein